MPRSPARGPLFLAAVAILLPALPSCSGCDESAALVVVLRTDLEPQTELSTVRTLFRGGGIEREVREPVATVAHDALTTGYRLAVLSGLEPGDAHVTLELRDPDGRTVCGRPIEIGVTLIAEVFNHVTVTVSRDCVASVCDDGGCEPPPCDAGACPEPECTTDDDCAPDVACAVPLCSGVTCLERRDDTACDPGERCAPGVGCERGGWDAGTPDAGGSDAGAGDAAVEDAGSDSGVDGGAGCGSCSAGRTCCAGACVPEGCDDGDPCTTDACDPGSGCTHTPSGDVCTVSYDGSEWWGFCGAGGCDPGCGPSSCEDGRCAASCDAVCVTNDMGDWCQCLNCD